MLKPKCSFGVVMRPCAATGAVARTTATSGRTANCASRLPGERVERVANMTSNLLGDGTERRYDLDQAYAAGYGHAAITSPELRGQRSEILMCLLWPLTSDLWPR